MTFYICLKHKNVMLSITSKYITSANETESSIYPSLFYFNT